MNERVRRRVRFTQHALEQMAKRGASEQEVSQAIAEAAWSPARGERFECAMNLSYGRVWHGRRYNTKQVVPIFRQEADAIVVITVYVFYF